MSVTSVLLLASVFGVDFGEGKKESVPVRCGCCHVTKLKEAPG